MILIPFLIVDIAFLGANIPKIPTGGWFPLLVGFALVIQMTTWRKGRQLVAGRIRRGEQPMSGGRRRGGRERTSLGYRARRCTCSRTRAWPRRRWSPTSGTTRCCTR